MRRWKPTAGRTAAITVPSAAAGALFLLSVGSFALLESNDPKVIDPEVAMPLIGALMMATPFGFFIALLPMFIGVMLMHWLGSWNLGLRHPAAWALAGGGMVGGVILAIGATDDSIGLAPGFIATGTLCALLARRYVRWPDEEEYR